MNETSRSILQHEKEHFEQRLLQMKRDRDKQLKEIVTLEGHIADYEKMVANLAEDLKLDVVIDANQQEYPPIQCSCKHYLNGYVEKNESCRLHAIADQREQVIAKILGT